MSSFPFSARETVLTVKPVTFVMSRSVTGAGGSFSLRLAMTG
jgi:hypothetical protein